MCLYINVNAQENIIGLNKARQMALAETIHIPIGYQAPEFGLPDTVSGKMISLKELAGSKGTLVMFICNHCPYVVHVRDKLIELANTFQPNGIQFMAISSNDCLNYPDDSPEKMKELAVKLNFPFPYLYDETQKVAKAYDASCTPDFSLFDANLTCVYRGRLDASTPGNNIPITGGEMIQALDGVLNDLAPISHQIPSIGCSIKWKQ